MSDYIIEMPNGGKPYWLADWKGDPGRTELLVNARRYPSKQAADAALTMAKKLYGDYRPSLLAGKIVRL